MKTLSLGNESIAFQSGAFFRDLTLIITDVRAQGSNDAGVMHKANMRIGQCINDHTGITVKANDVSFGNFAFILSPCLTRGNVLYTPTMGKWLENNFTGKKIKSMDDLASKGWIDPKTSRVGGAFCDIMHDMYLSHQYLLGKEFTPEEVAGIIIHETGHAYNFLAFLADTIIVNNVLLRAYQELTNGKPDKKIKIILSNAADDLSIKNREWVTAIDDDEDGAVAFKLLATAVQIEPRGMDNKTYFTQYASEELADIFAARHGAGRAIITLRAKFKMESPTYGYAYGLAFALLGIIMTPVMPALGGPFLGYAATMLSISASRNMSDAKSMLDVTSFKQSATKMRNQFVEELKSSKLPKDKVASLVDNINLADRMIQEHKEDYAPSVLTKFFDMFRRGKMEARASREYTDKLEVMVSNNLFMRAAQFAR